jgi:thiol-disulfide isomerase/thioredoxin
MLRPFLLLYFALSAGSLLGQPVLISGKAIDYAGKELVFYTYPEPISHQQRKLGEARVGTDGNFSLSFNTDQTIEIYAELEKYRGTLVVEPHAHYQVNLPPYSPRTVQEAASPYFEPAPYWIGIKETKPSELNILVRAFLTDYNKELATHTRDLYQKKSADTAKAIISRLDRAYPTGKDHYLNILKTYSYGDLEFTVTPSDRELIAKKYFGSKEICLTHPAYQHLFQALFSDYLTYKSQDIKQKGFLTQAIKGNFDQWVHQLEGIGFKKEIAELVAAKSFYDGFYSNKFNKALMLKGLKEAAAQATFELLKESLPVILSKITALQEGSPAPVLLIKNQNNASTALRAKGKFVYLAFFRSDSKVCRAELDSLVVLAKKLNTVLAIVPVSMDENFADAVNLWKEKKYPWELTGAADREKARSDYRIKSLPTFYLIAPDQKLLLSPALSPTHNFEALFLKIYREQRFRGSGR